MPAVAVVAAGFSISAGVAALGAAATLGATIAAGASIVGGVLGGIGALTGNSKLTKIGAVLGIAGGVGTAFSSSASSAASDSSLYFSDGNMVNSTAQTAGTSGLPVAGSASDGMLSSADPFSESFGSASLPTDGIQTQAATGQTTQGMLGIQQNTPVIGAPAPTTAFTAAPGVPTNPGGGLLGQAMEALKKNPELAKIVAGGVSGTAKALGSMEEQRRAAALQQQARDRYSQSILGQAQYRK